MSSPYARPGSILWLPNDPNSSISPGKLDHPVLVLASSPAGCYVCLITSFRSTPILEKFPASKHMRARYLPLHPAPPHPDNKLLLRAIVKGRPIVPSNEKDSYVSITDSFFIKSAVRLLPLYNGSSCLDRQSLEVVKARAPEFINWQRQQGQQSTKEGAFDSGDFLRQRRPESAFNYEDFLRSGESDLEDVLLRRAVYSRAVAANAVFSRKESDWQDVLRMRAMENAQYKRDYSPLDSMSSGIYTVVLMPFRLLWWCIRALLRIPIWIFQLLLSLIFIVVFFAIEIVKVLFSLIWLWSSLR
ncbi:hypothetical protein EDC01DRAFT_673802 [Geopyxis carbonaria]|nr:hypothetical protein EDC01DRAFT_673802 [Geopyxis carbonaria]